MATPKRYTIEKISDVFQIPADKFDAFLVDFKTYYELGAPMAELLKDVADTGGINVEVVPLHMTWIDDGKHDAEFIIKTEVSDNDQI